MLDRVLDWLLLVLEIVVLILDPLVERLLLGEDDECTLDAVELKWGLTDDGPLVDALVAGFEDETMLDEDEVGCAKLVDNI